MDLTDALAAWGLPPPRRVERSSRGTNGEVLIFDDAYVLRHYHPVDPRRIRAEHRLLAELEGHGGCAFRVPVAGAAIDGSTLVGSAALFDYLPGAVADHDDLAALTAAGTALGQLHGVLAELGPELAPWDWRCSLDQIHPLVPSCAQMITALRAELGPVADLNRLERYIVEMSQAVPRLLNGLPVQIIHGDFALANVLFDAGRVSAVLDFETAGIDLRAADVAAALLMAAFAGNEVDRADRDERCQAVLAGYADVVALTVAERTALPMLIRRRAAGSIVWRVGRWRAGLADLADVRDRLALLADVDRWLSG